MTYIDAIAVALVVIFLVYTLFLCFDFISHLLIMALNPLKTWQKPIHYALVLISIPLTYFSYTQHSYLAAAIVAGLVLIDVCQRTSQSSRVLFTVLVYLLLFVDKYVVEVWRMQDNRVHLHMHYMHGQTPQHIPLILLLYVMLLINDVDVIT